MDFRKKWSLGLVLLLLALLSPAIFRSARKSITLSRLFPRTGSREPFSRDEDALGIPTQAKTNYVAPIPQAFRCSPAPCVLPNVDVSAGPMPVNETPIAVNPTNPNQLLASANDRNCTANIQGIYTSGDGGNTWTHSCMGNLRGSYGGGDPTAAYDLHGNAYVTGLTYGVANGIVIEKSSDNGKTWSGPSLAISGPGIDKDKEWLHIDTSTTSPYANRLYISVSQFDSSNDSLISVSHSTGDGAANWTTVTVEPYQAFPITEEESYISTAADGTVYLTWTRCTDNQQNNGCGGEATTIEFSKSSDGGNTWTTPVAIINTVEAPYIKCTQNFGGFFGVLPNTCDRVSDTPATAVDNSIGQYEGSVYLTYYRWTGQYLQLFVATSTDGGATWTSTAVAPGSDTHDQFYPWISVSSQGVVGVSWLDRRNDPANVNYEAFAAFSTDGGASFSKSIKLSAKPSNPFNDGWGNGLHFMGDYTGNTWSPDGKIFYVTYTDTTTNVDQDFLAGIRF